MAASKALDISLSHGQHQMAREIADSMVNLAKQLNQTETPQTLRDLSVSLNKMGDVAREQGALEESQQYYAEAKSVLELLENTFPQKKAYLR